MNMQKGAQKYTSQWIFKQSTAMNPRSDQETEHLSSLVILLRTWPLLGMATG